MVNVSPASQFMGMAEKTFRARRIPPVEALNIPASLMFMVPDKVSAEEKVASHKAVSPDTVVVVWVIVAVLRLTSFCRAVSVADSAAVPVPMARWLNFVSVKPAKTSRIMAAKPTLVMMFFLQ